MVNTSELLRRCQDEPIHIPGAIQPRGLLLAVEEEELQVIVASANAAERLGASTLTGANLGQWMDDEGIAQLREALAGEPANASPITATLGDLGRCEIDMHRADGLLLLETEFRHDTALPVQTTLRSLIGRLEALRNAATVTAAMDIAARETQRLTGFDRVMVYRFEEDNSGQVIAEVLSDDDQESYLGLHYPAGDIPPQARRLYVENPVRLIDDAAYAPVPLQPEINPRTGRPLDLSHAQLRSVSPIHCQYLANMGVRSSMSISLVHGERLWGLIACHHREPWCPPPDVRLLAEFIAQVLSSRVTELERLEAAAHKDEAFAVQARLIEQMASAARFQDGLAGEGPTLADLLPCDGAAILFRGEVTRIGSAPDEENVRALAAALGRRSQDVLAVDHLAALYPPAADFADTAAGLIRVPLSADGNDVLFWFRGERTRSITWAGRPPEKDQEDSPDQLKPRASFAAWVETVRGHSEPWQEWEIEVASDLRTALVAGVIHQAAELERLNARLVESGRDKDRLMATVSHELRNPLSAIIGWSRLARSGIKGAELDKAMQIIERNAEAQAALIDDLLDMGRIHEGRLELENRVLNFETVVERSLDSLRPMAQERGIEIDARLAAEGAMVVGDPRRLQQVIWNLVSNAVKFSDDDSRIDVVLTREGSNVCLRVTDEGQGMEAEFLPKVFGAFSQGAGGKRRAGLGLGLSIVKSIVELHGGEVAAASDGPGKGSEFTVWLPVSPVITEKVAGDLSRQFDFGGARILVVDDHGDAAHMVATVLQGQGARTEEAGDGLAALARLRAAPFDLVISDLDMPRMNGFELVQAMREDPHLESVPAVALTAFIRSGDRARALGAGFRQHVSKPVDAAELLVVVDSLLQAPG